MKKFVLTPRKIKYAKHKDGAKVRISSKTSCCHEAETRDFSHERSRPMISIIKYVCHFTKLYDIIIL